MVLVRISFKVTEFGIIWTITTSNNTGTVTIEFSGKTKLAKLKAPQQTYSTVLSTEYQ